MVISTGTYDCSTLDGFTILNEEEKMIGLITYIIKDNECEIISLDSIEEGRGIGTTLVQEVENLALQRKCKLVKLITTNDNLVALKFYQKRGFFMSKVINNAVEKARKIKPEIPFIGNDGIPIRDEIELIKVID
ncbi:acetyltransferase [Halalkalibacter wakoensis JCM 9140]|uniref:Acetyltransferase n=2 Tax=Halalkalibacter wakoensis TaxID=127891 RepID=W4Q3Y1_9BACI|nr:acetyltransferase [Halalkalibacter wakoensis JCM 9140]